MDPEKDAGSVFDTPLIKWKEEGPHPEGRTQTNCEWYGPNKVVSDGDRAFVKNVYTWN
jgi:hypothetical protein